MKNILCYFRANAIIKLKENLQHLHSLAAYLFDWSETRRELRKNFSLEKLIHRSSFIEYYRRGGKMFATPLFCEVNVRIEIIQLLHVFPSSLIARCHRIDKWNVTTQCNFRTLWDWSWWQCRKLENSKLKKAVRLLLIFFETRELLKSKIC